MTDLQKKLNSIWPDWIIQETLGKGAYGAVYRIWREDKFGHRFTAALKVITIPATEEDYHRMINEGMDEESTSDYFQSIVEDLVEEIVLMSKLKGNTNIVSYEDHAILKEEDDFQWHIFIRMELLTPLYDYMKNHEFSVNDVVFLGIEMCNALELCQNYNIIHRDIKPENIFVSDVGRFKLGDFGIARQLDKTSTGLSMKGTYSYIAPEVFKGEAYNATVDIYSLGMVLYRILNNNRGPFMPPYPEKIRYSDRERSNMLRMSGKELPCPANAEERLGEIVLKACAYDPDERYQSAVALGEELEGVYNKYSEYNKEPDIFPDNQKEDPGQLQSNEKVNPVNSDSSDIPGDIDTYTNVLQFEKGKNDDISKHAELHTLSKESEENNHEVGIRNTTQDQDANSNQIQIKTPKNRKQIVLLLAALILGISIIIFFGIQNRKNDNNNESTATAIQESEEIPSEETTLVEVPDLSGKSLDEAKTILEDKKIRLIKYTHEWSDDVNIGHVISQSVSPGTMIEENGMIDLVVSRGVKKGKVPDSTDYVDVSKGEHLVEVPNLIGKQLDEAKKILEDQKLRLIKYTYEWSDDVNIGHVISQSVSPGTMIEENGMIDLVVSRGVKK